MTFTSKQIESEVGIKVNTLHYYVQSGAIDPIDPGSGRGTRRIFSEKNFIEAIILKRLLDLRLPKQTILNFFKELKLTNEWTKLDPRRIIEQRKKVLIIFYAHGNTIKITYIIEDIKGKDTNVKSFKDITDQEFFNTLMGNNKYEVKFQINEWVEAFSIIDVTAIMVNHIHLFNKKGGV